jgi:hypothetical protein
MTADNQERDDCPRVLLLEGNPSIAKFLSIILRKSGFDVMVEGELDGKDLSSDFDLAILSSSAISNKRTDMESLRRRLPAHIILYGPGVSGEFARKIGADIFLEEFYEPDRLIEAVKIAIGTSHCN